MSNIRRRSVSHTALVGLTAMCATGVFVVAGLSACGSGSSATGSSATGSGATGSGPTVTTISLQNIAIHPSTVTIHRGSTVKWVWLDGHLDTFHNVTPRPNGSQFKASGTQLTGSYSVRFDTPGKYLYECTIHPASMQAQIVVE
jgi:plastocyanin